MKLLKTQRIAYLQRVIERDQRFHLCIGAALYVPWDNVRNLLTEAAMWKMVAKALGAETPLDEMVAKSRGEFLVAGSAFAPGGTPRTAVSVKVRVGELEKKLTVVGDRHWGARGASDPVPFTEMPVAWENAFGGEGFAPNPVGKGFAAAKGVHPLPNVEHPEKLVRAPGDRPPPAGFRPIDIMWPPRAGKAGTYDDRWLKEDFPGLARDADWTIYNVAPVDQWHTGFFRGDEAWSVENMHPQRTVMEGRLPNAVVRCFVNRVARAGLTEVAMRAETVWLFPSQERLVVIYRGVEEVDDDDAPDIDHMLLAVEDPAAPRDFGYYRAALDARLHPEDGGAAIMREGELMPDWPLLPVAGVKEEMAALENLGLVFRNLQKKAVREGVAARERVAALGLDPDLHAPSVPDPANDLVPSFDDVPRLMKEAEAKAKAQREAMEAKRKVRQADMRKKFEAMGMDYSVIEKEMNTSKPGPPKPKAPEKLQILQSLAQEARRRGVVVEEIEEMLVDPLMLERLRAADEGAMKNYITAAHHWTPAPRKDPEFTAQARETIARHLEAGGTLAGTDLTGLDLSGMNLRGRDLRAALMENTLLVETDLSDAILTDAVLTRAELTRTVFTGANLEGANLGCAKLSGTILHRANLKGAQLYRADFDGADLTGADLTGASIIEARFKGSILREAVCSKLMFYKVDLSGMDLRGARLNEAMLIECTADGTDFSGAEMNQVSLVMTSARGARFVETRMRNARIQIKTDLTGCDFKRAVMPESNLRDVPLTGADFSGANIEVCDFSGCKLEGAQFVAADARGTRWVRADLSDANFRNADLMEAVLQKATLDGASFRDAGLYAADMARVIVRRPANMDGAHLSRVRVYPKRKHEPR